MPLRGARLNAHQLGCVWDGPADRNVGRENVHLALRRLGREGAAQVPGPHARCLAAASHSSRPSIRISQVANARPTPSGRATVLASADPIGRGDCAARVRGGPTVGVSPGPDQVAHRLPVAVGHPSIAGDRRARPFAQEGQGRRAELRAEDQRVEFHVGYSKGGGKLASERCLA